MSDTMREAFEAWSSKRYPGTPLNRYQGLGYEDLYESGVARWRWEAWQAAQSQPAPPQTLPGISDAQVLEYCDKHPDATFAEAVLALAAQPHAAPAPSSVQEIVSLMMPYVAACVKFNHTPRGQIGEVGAEVLDAFMPLEAALTALVEERDRLRFELAGVNAMAKLEKSTNTLSEIESYKAFLFSALKKDCEKPSGVTAGRKIKYTVDHNLAILAVRYPSLAEAMK